MEVGGVSCRARLGGEKGARGRFYLWWVLNLRPKFRRLPRSRPRSGLAETEIGEGPTLGGTCVGAEGRWDKASLMKAE